MSSVYFSKDTIMPTFKYGVTLTEPSNSICKISSDLYHKHDKKLDYNDLTKKGRNYCPQYGEGFRSPNLGCGKLSKSRTNNSQTLYERLEVMEKQVRKLKEEVSSTKEKIKYYALNKLILGIAMHYPTTSKEIIQLKRLYCLIRNNQNDPNFVEKWFDNLMNWLMLLEPGCEREPVKDSFDCQLWKNIDSLLESYDQSFLPSTILTSSPLVSVNPFEFFLDDLCVFTNSSLFETRVQDIPLDFNSIDYNAGTPSTQMFQEALDDNIQQLTVENLSFHFKGVEPEQKKTNSESKNTDKVNNSDNTSKGSKRKRKQQDSISKRRKSDSKPKIRIIYPPRKYTNVIFDQKEEIVETEETNWASKCNIS
ncbi:17513_t:CDS:2 [Acaulospora colombiana]|uniref:17513_t:CDS:1 n=1 Tax=Acaulospora colombiana TaxID=27376 RepID=A0ACA9L2J9_9GLOM|nr:17513_t:CDS:2 [Acaulospora colombiana]